MTNDIHFFQNYISAYPAHIVKKLTGAINSALAVSTKKDHYWIINNDDRCDISEPFGELFETLAYPKSELGIPLTKNISSSQLPLLHVISRFEGLRLNNFAFPKYASARQRWLGLQPAGIAEKEISVGDFHQVPLWYALQLCRRSNTMKIPELLSTLSLTLDERLELFGSMSIEEYHDMNAKVFLYDYPWGKLSDITVTQVPWAITWADKLTELNKWRESEQLLWPVFAAFTKGNVSIKPEWEQMLLIESLNDEKFEILKGLLNLIPEIRRTQVISHRVSKSRNIVVTGLHLLYLHPSSDLTELILHNIDKNEVLSPKEIIKRVSEVAEKSPAVRSTLDAYNARQNGTAITLKISKTLIPDSYDDLNKTHQKQLEKSGELYGAEEYPLDERIPFFASDSKLAKDESDLNFAKQLHIHSIGDGKGKHIYDAFLYMTESGTIFKAKKTDVVATIAQGALSCSDPALKIALLNALGK